MTDEERMIVKKLHLEGMGSRKISQRTGLSENTVKSFLRRQCSQPENLVPQTVPEIPVVQDLTFPNPCTSREEDVAIQESTAADVIPALEPESCQEAAVEDLGLADSQDVSMNKLGICKEKTEAEQEQAIMTAIPFATSDILQEEAAASSEPVNCESGAIGLCIQCGNPITRKAGRKQKRFCSAVCRKKYWRHHPELSKSKSDRICPACGRAFSICGSSAQKYCSRECYLNSHSKGNIRIPGGAL